MDRLTMDLVQLCRRHPEGAFGTRKNRFRGLTAMAREIAQLGYDLPSARSLKPKHVQALVEHWRQRDVTDNTMKNRVTWLRWWAQKINKAAVVPRDNAELGLTNANDEPINRAQNLDRKKLATITCPYVRASLLLQEAFGLRREEAIKFRPKDAISARHIALRGSWTKGGKQRAVPITTPQQQAALLAVREFTSLIPPTLNYRQQLKRYERLTLAAGLRNTHGLRHTYAQNRFKTLTGFACPLAGGKRWSEMSATEREADRAARLQIARELGHNRLQITHTYLGRAA